MRWIPVALMIILGAGRAAGDVSRSHSHNDYLQPRPLATALEARMGSVEVDVWLKAGELLVAHAEAETVVGRTLRSLYLEPLRLHLKARAGSVYPEGSPLVLLIDIKSEAEATYQAVESVLAEYRDMITEFRDGRVTERAVTVLISGNVPKATLLGQAFRLAAADGRPGDLETDPPVAAVPVISTNWRSFFSWDGLGSMPVDEKHALRQWVERCHAQGRKVRLWAAPDTETAWREQADAGVDFINTDQPAALHAFLVSYRGPTGVK